MKQPGSRRRRIEEVKSPRWKRLAFLLFLIVAVIRGVQVAGKLLLKSPAASERVVPRNSEEDPGQRDRRRAKLNGFAALKPLQELLVKLEGRVRVLEAGRLRGDFGDASSGRLMKAWEPWAREFREELRQTALLHEVELSPLNQKQLTPVHAAYALVDEACRDVGRAWAQGQGVEGLPALAAASRSVGEAQHWLLQDNR